MKKLRYSRRLARSQEQPAPLETRIFAEQQAEAKQGVISSPSGADANLRTLGDPSPQTNTISGVIRAALQLVAALKGVVINFVTGKAVIVPTGYADPAPSGVLNFGRFEKDDPTKASSPWTWTETSGGDSTSGINDQMEALVAARKPAMSVESLTNSLEDAGADPVGALSGVGGVGVHYDQADGIIRVFGAGADGLATYDPAAAYAEDAAFVRTVAATGPSQFGE